MAHSAPTATAPVIEFYNQDRDHYFLTQDPLEAEKLDLRILPGWARTGQSFVAYVAGASDGRGSSVARLYGLLEAGLGTHVFTALGEEIVALINSGKWMYQTSGAFELVEPNRRTGDCPTGTRPLYRIWNGRRDTNHRYTTDADTRRAMLTRGWIAEGQGADVTFLCAP